MNARDFAKSVGAFLLYLYGIALLVAGCTAVIVLVLRAMGALT